MKLKFKINNETTLDDALEELEKIKKCNLKELPMNHLVKIMEFIGVEPLSGAGGSGLRFRHECLVDEPYFTDGIFQVHRIHKGGAEIKIRIHDYKKYLYPTLIKIISIKKQKI